MAKRKQQRRRAKERRHEYEDVWVDADGNELAPDEVDDAAVTPTATKASGSAKGKAAPARGRGGRVVPPPSWSRVGKRALIFAPIMFITVYLIGSKLTLTAKLIQTGILLVFFLPFSYAMDSFNYRSYLKRTGQAPKPKQKT